MGKGKKIKAFFLDRDGVINRDPGDYTYRPEDFEMLPGVAETVAEMQRRGFVPVVITNQGGIARGIYTFEDVEQTHRKMIELFEAAGVNILDIFYSPHHDLVGNSLDRKPGSLMFERAMALYNIDMSQSVMIGDSERDCIAARNAGVGKCYLIPKNSSIAFILEKEKK